LPSFARPFRHRRNRSSCIYLSPPPGGSSQQQQQPIAHLPAIPRPVSHDDRPFGHLPTYLPTYLPSYRSTCLGRHHRPSEK
jgi:hypothetical protein